MRGCSAIACAVLVVAPTIASAEAGRAVRRDVDTSTLAKLLDRRGFVPPSQFKALVLEVGRSRDGRVTTRALSYRRTALDRDGWWPASSVKLFAAIAALERLHGLGFTPAARVTFRYSTGDVSTTVEQLVRDAITMSVNEAFDRLVEIVGFDELNGRFLARRNGIASTVLLRGYGGRVLDPVTKRGSLRHSPRIAVTEGARTREFPELLGTGTFDCPDDGNCTTLADLAEAMRRVMLHDELPRAQRYDLGVEDLELLRSALEAERPRGQNVVVGLREAFGAAPVRLYHKPGFALQWFSDCVFVRRLDTGAEWIVAMAGRPGRGALDDAARHVGALLSSESLRSRENDGTSASRTRAE